MKLSLKVNGLDVYIVCQDVFGEIASVFEHAKQVVGGLGQHGWLPLFQAQVPEYMEQANLKFLKWSIGYEMK